LALQSTIATRQTIGVVVKKIIFGVYLSDLRHNHGVPANRPRPGGRLDRAGPFRLDLLALNNPRTAVGCSFFPEMYS
jgi:hypothetical protein